MNDLPLWAEELPKNKAAYVARLIIALELAWEALIYYRESDEDRTAEETMRAIEELEE